MKFIKKLSLFIPLLFLTSCGGVKESFIGKIVTDSSNLSATTTKYDYKSGEELEISSITVKYNDNSVPYEEEAPNPKPGYFFITKSNTTPTASRVTKENLKLQISEEKKDETFYIGYILEDNSQLHVSKSITIHITNSQAMKKWVYWVVGSIVLFGCVALIYFSRKYKHDHPTK